MKIAYYTYPTAFNFFGGGEVQLLKTKDFVEKANCSYQIKLFNTFKDKLEQFDIFHNFSLSPDCYNICELAKSKGAKLVLSPIYWNDSELKTATRFITSWQATIKNSVENFFINFKNLYENVSTYGFATFRPIHGYKRFLDLADLILPNSRLEASLISTEFKINAEKLFPIPNGVDKSFFKGKPDLFVEKYGLKDFVLFVGRLESRKNIVPLLKAYSDIDAPLVLIGHPSSRDPDYYGSVKKIIRNNRNIHYLGFMPPGSPELISAYAAAKVFVLPSWFETPGLAALEAGLAGCNVVITDRGSTTEYFRDLAWYVDPRSETDMNLKIKAALDAPNTNKLSELILHNYTWEKVAEKTIEAYKMMLY